MNKWDEKEVRIMADLTVKKELLYRDVYLLADKDVSILKDKILYYFFDNDNRFPIFPIYQDRQFIQHCDWRPISREVFEKVLDVFIELQNKEKWEYPLEIDIIDNNLNSEHSIEFTLDIFGSSKINSIEQLNEYLKKYKYQYEVTTHSYMLGYKIYYKDKIEDVVEGESW